MKVFVNIRTVLALLLCFGFFGATSVFASAVPTEQLEPVIAAIMSILEDESFAGADKKDERRKAIMCRVKEVFDFQEMSKRILGKTWRKISDDERARFTKEMTALLENTYISRLEEYSGEKIHYVNERIKGKKAQVDTTVDDGKITIPVSYIMIFNEESKWMVYDMTIEGVSLIRNYREQFRSILRKDKFSGLIKLLEEKNESFSNK